MMETQTSTDLKGWTLKGHDVWNKCMNDDKVK